MRKSIVTEVNLLDVLAVVFILLVAYLMQFVQHELPCPLCLLQRLGILMIGFGFLLNLRFNIKTSHYAISLLGALYTATVSLRQIALHVIPGTGSYGLPFLGLHLYTWTFIMAVGFIIFICCMLLWDKQFNKFKRRKTNKIKIIKNGAIIIVIILALANTFTTYLECGLKQCPENPKLYKHAQAVSPATALLPHLNAPRKYTAFNPNQQPRPNEIRHHH